MFHQTASESLLSLGVDPMAALELLALSWAWETARMVNSRVPMRLSPGSAMCIRACAPDCSNR